MSINDLSDTIEAKSDQLNAADLMGADKVIKITDVVRYVDKGVNKFYLSYEGDSGRPYKPSLTMRRIIMKLWSKDGSVYIGRKLRLYRDDSITFGKERCGGIVIGAMSDIPSQATVKQQVSQRVYKEFKIEKLQHEDKQTWPDDAFNAKFDGLQKAVLAGTSTKEQAITKMQVKADLTDEQKQRIRDIEINMDELEIPIGEITTDE